MLHYYLPFSFHLKLALLTQSPTSNERKIPPHLKIKPAKFHNGGFTQDLYMHICSISVKSCGKTVWMRLKASPALKGLINIYLFYYCVMIVKNSPIVWPMLAYRLSRWPNVGQTLDRFVVVCQENTTSRFKKISIDSTIVLWSRRPTGVRARKIRGLRKSIQISDKITSDKLPQIFKILN